MRSIARRPRTLDRVSLSEKIIALELIFHRRAEKVLRRIQPKTMAAITAALERIAAAPFDQHPNVKPLAGTKDGFRLRHGDWRVLYRIDRTANRMIVEIVGPRGDVYK